MLNARPVRRAPETEKRFRPAVVSLRPRAEDHRSVPPTATRRAGLSRSLAWLRPVAVAAALGAVAIGLVASTPARDHVTGALTRVQEVAAHGAWGAEQIARGHLVLLASVRDLEAQNGRLRREVQRLREADRERRSLAHLLQLSEGSDVVGASARVVARGAGGRQTLRIDAGAERGIRPGLAVLGPKGVAGQVLDAGTGWADVLAVTDPSAGLAARIEDGPHGLLRGTREGLAMDHVMARHAVAPGMRVVATGEGGVYPAGMLVGVVTRAEPEPGTPFLAIEVEAVASPELIDEVFVVTGTRPPEPEVAIR